jgi:hypothetical protein
LKQKRLSAEIIFDFLRTFEPPARGRLVGKFHGKARAFGPGFFRFGENRAVYQIFQARASGIKTSQVSLLFAEKLPYFTV